MVPIRESADYLSLNISALKRIITHLFTLTKLPPGFVSSLAASPTVLALRAFLNITHVLK